MSDLIEGKFAGSPGQGQFTVRLDRPSDPYQVSGLTVNAFLYDVREDVALRANGPSITRDGSRVAVAVRRPPLLLLCSYLVSTWAGSEDKATSQEHRLLGDVIRRLAVQPTVPDELLTRHGLAGPVPLGIADVESKGGLAEFWSAVGSKIRPSFVLRATISLELSDPAQVVTVKSHELRVGMTPYLIEGVVANLGRVPARVTIRELGRETKTDEAGRYRFLGVPAGTYTLDVQKIGAGAAPGREKRVSVPPTEKFPDYDLTF